MDEDIEKLLRYLNTNYRERITVDSLISKGFDINLIEGAKMLQLVKILPLVHSRRNRKTEDARECKLTKDGLKLVREMKSSREHIKIGTQNIISKTEDNSVRIGKNTLFKGNAAIGKNAKITSETHFTSHKKSFQDNIVLYIIAGIIIIVVAAIIVHYLIK